MLSPWDYPPPPTDSPAPRFVRPLVPHRLANAMRDDAAMARQADDRPDPAELLRQNIDTPLVAWFRRNGDALTFWFAMGVILLLAVLVAVAAERGGA